MQVQYGSYTHAEGEVAIARQLEPVRDQSGTLRATVHRYNLQGVLTADSESAMDTAVSNLIAAYVDGSDLALLFTVGGNTQLALASSDCIGGTRVTRPPEFPDMRGAGYTAYLPYAITVEGEIAASSSADTVGLLSYSETVQYSGGGPRYAHRETLQGAPIKQQVRRQTINRMTQSGEAVGYIGYPTPPPPLFAGALVESPQITLVSPRWRGGRGYTEYRVAWSYVFESASPLLAAPNKQVR